MAFLLLLILTLICLQGDWPKPAWLDPVTGIVVTWAGVAVLVGAAGLMAQRLRRRLAIDPGNRSAVLRRFGKFRRYQGYALLAFYLVALYAAGWGWAVKETIWRAAGLVPGMELLILAPFLVGLILSWAVFYGMERVAHATAPLAGDAEPFPGRWAYVFLQLRHNLLLVFPPLVLLIVQQTVFWLCPSLQSERLFPLFAVALLAGIFIGIPLVLRVLLGLKPLPEGPLRDRLLATARRLKFRCNDILLWRTRNAMANAMVTGPLPLLRYVVLTDRLVQDMAPEEVEAVFGHEVGHVKHQHMLFYFGFLVASLVVVAGMVKVLQEESANFLAERAPEVNAWLQDYEFLGVLPMLALVGTYVFVVFGFLSRRCERQADIYGCRTVSPQVFIEALEKVARLNGISRDRPGWLSSWQHSTIARRVAFLQQMCFDPTLEPRFQRRVWLIKWSMLATLGLCVTTLVYWLGPAGIWMILAKL
jgi:Zn-dependent protease with chaperone function